MRVKSPSEWKLIGTAAPRIDLAAKTDGSAVFGIDVRPAGLVYAAIRHCPMLGGSPGAVDVAVGDSTGELRAMTQLADVVFVGKSLAPHTEGQTPVEAAALGKPILFGPGMGNFRSIARDLLERGAARKVAGAADLASQAAALLGDPAQRALLAAAASAWQRDNGGALDRTLVAIREELAKVP